VVTSSYSMIYEIAANSLHKSLHAMICQNEAYVPLL